MLLVIPAAAMSARAEGPLPHAGCDIRAGCDEGALRHTGGLLQIRRRRRNRPTKSLRLVAVRRSAADSAVFGRSPSAYGAILRQPPGRDEGALRSIGRRPARE